MDRLSDLTDALLLHILLFMPMQDAVRTTVLSKRWKNLWIHTQSLIFHDFITMPPYINYHDFINRTLFFRGAGNIMDFSIRIHVKRDMDMDMTMDINSSFMEGVDLWIRYALRNNAKGLFLNFSFDLCCLPQCMYTNSSVIIMRLSWCDISSARQITWSSLENLILHCGNLEGDVIHTVLLGCPNLKFLEVSDCVGFIGLNTNSTSLKKLKIVFKFPDTGGDDNPELRVSAPNVTSLHLSGPFIKECLLVNMSSLVQASIDCFAYIYRVDEFNAYRESMFKFLDSLDHVKNLTLGAWFLKVLSIKEKKGLPSRPSKRKCLTLATCMKQEDLPGILHVLKCSPDLEKLVLSMTPPSSETQERFICSVLGGLARFSNYGGESYLKSNENTIDCLLQHLKIVKIYQFVDQDSVFRVVEFLLKKAKVLEIMEIRAKKRPSSSLESLLHTAQKLLAIPRSSPRVVVTFLT